MASIPIRRLDDLVEKGEVVIDRPIGAIKIDVEGNEVPAMLGMEKLLSQHLARVIIVETVDSHLQRAGTSRTELIELMKRLGYRVQTSNGILGRPPINTAFVPRSSA